jgi:mono/diheme cytochrome c family protein
MRTHIKGAAWLTGLGVILTGAAVLSGGRLLAQGTAMDLYLDKCAVCHGQDGAGKTARGRKLKVQDVRETSLKMTAAQMEEVVIKGKSPDMDAYGKELTADQVKQVVEYYRSLATKK